MRSFVLAMLAGLVVGCGPATDARDQEPSPELPPPMPENAETVVFERVAPGDKEQMDETGAADETNGERPLYWGIEPGEPLPIMWEDLMPEGSFEELLRQQEEFYAMLRQRYAANATTLADANTFEEIEEGSELDYMPQFGTFEVVEDLDGELVRIPGYVVPFDFDPKQRHREFLFVPYMGACIHTPPPPPNQIIFVRADPAIRVEDIWAPYWLEGTLSAEQNLNNLGDAAYALSLASLEPYPILGAGQP